MTSCHGSRRATSFLILSFLTIHLLLAAPPAAQAVFTFGTPDASLPGTPGTGLSATLWSSSAIEPVNTLEAARAYIAANARSATFVSTVVDYPNGAVGSGSTDALLSDALGVAASEPGLVPGG